MRLPAPRSSVVFLMLHLLAVGAIASLLLGAAPVLSVPIAIATLGIATLVIAWLAGRIGGSGAARASAALLLSAAALKLASPVPASLSAPSTLALLWWMPLVACAWMAHPDVRRPLGALLLWWSAAALAAMGWPAEPGAMASIVETGPAALLGGVAVSRLATGSAATRTRLWLAGALAVTASWEAWLVLGTGRPARFLVPLLVAALLVAATDVLTHDEPGDRRTVGAALVIAMLVLGLMPGAHALIERRHLIAQAVPSGPLGADAP